MRKHGCQLLRKKPATRSMSPQTHVILFCLVSEFRVAPSGIRGQDLRQRAQHREEEGKGFDWKGGKAFIFQLLK